MRAQFETFLAGHGLSVELMVAAVLIAILVYASAKDVMCREVSDWVPFGVLVLGLCVINKDNLVTMLLGAVVTGLPLMISALTCRERSLGGADIKLMIAAGFLLGVERGIVAVLVGIGLGALGQLMLYVIKRIRGKDADLTGSFALIPYLSVAIVGLYLI